MGCWLRISSGEGFHLWLLGTLVHITLLVMTALKTVELQTEYLDYLRGMCNPLVRVRSVWLVTLKRQKRDILIYPVIKILPTFGLFNSYFFWWRFSFVTVGRAILPNLFGNDTVGNSWGANLILRLFTRNILSFGSSSVCVVSNIYETQRVWH